MVILEIRYVKPYFSSIEVNFFPIVIGVPVQNSAGQQGILPQDQKESVKVNITGWLAGQQVRSDNLEFKDEGYNAIINIASQMGVDLLNTFNVTFDQIADVFPVTKEQDEGAKSIGPAIYLRPERFVCNLNPATPKSLVVTVGVYSDSEFKNRKSYLELVFEDGASKRNRAARLVQLKESRDMEMKILDETHPNWGQWTGQQRSDLKKYAEANVPNYNRQIVEAENQIVGSLDMLIGTDSVETDLQKSTKTMAGVICAATLALLKQTNPDYKDIDVQAIMSEFSIPDVK